MTTLSKEEYLKRYLDPVKSGDYRKKKKKNNEKVKKIRGMKIVDDDISWNKITPREEDELPEELLMKEEMPSVEEIDERTKEEKALDVYRKGDKWRMVENTVDNKVSRSSKATARHDSDSDMDVPRKARHNSPDSKRHSNKKSRHDSNSDIDIPSRSRHGSNSFETTHLKRKSRHDSDSDIEVPSKSRLNSASNREETYTKKSSKHRHDSDSDLDVRRKPTRHDSSSDNSGDKRIASKNHRPRHSDQSKRSNVSDKNNRSRRDSYNNSKKHTYSKSSRKHTNNDNSDSDLEIPRRKTLSKGRHDSDSDLDLPRQNQKNGSKIKSGAIGGLTSREELKRELKEKKKIESSIDKLAKESQKETVFREKGGKKRDLEKEKMQKDAEDKVKQKKLDKYNQWGKGLTQTEMKDYALEDLIHEASKPLARYADDADLDAYQRSIMRDGDPMAEYLAKKRSKEAGNVPSMPKYRGPAAAPNRYGIQPGYRWDGVDRSNGFEKKFFNSRSESSALRQEAYKWSVEDM